jgi:thioesterase domain-containing protein/acyl carrier protein
LRRRLRQLNVGSPDSPGERPERLVGYVVPKSGRPAPSPEELRRYLGRRLPPFMVPASIVSLPALPLLPNGKVDRQALASSAVDTAMPPDTVTLTATHIMKIWDELIDVQQIGLDDNFFALGGHSLLVPRLLDRLHQDFGVALPLGAFFESPTVRALTSLVEARSGPSWRLLVPIRERGTRSPLFMVHGLGGEIGYFYNVADYMHPEQPVYGVQAPAEPFDDLEMMAAHYLEAIREHQPHGPYLLGGYCIGGCVAFEMARRLSNLGEDVALVVMIDAVMPGPLPLRRQLDRFAAKPAGEKLRALARRARIGLSRLSGADEDVIPSFYGVPRAFHAIAQRHYHAQATYVPKPFEGHVSLLRTEHGEFDRDLGWGTVVRGRLDVHMVPGSHAEVLKEPYVPATARLLSSVVEATLKSRVPGA